MLQEKTCDGGPFRRLVPPGSALLLKGELAAYHWPRRRQLSAVVAPSQLSPVVALLKSLHLPLLSPRPPPRRRLHSLHKHAQTALSRRRAFKIAPSASPVATTAAASPPALATSTRAQRPNAIFVSPTPLSFSPNLMRFIHARPLKTPQHWIPPFCACSSQDKSSKRTD